MEGEINLASGTNLNIETNSLSSTGLNSNGTININSTPTNNGSFIPASITQSGTVIYNRYATKTNWHLFSSPVGGQDVSTFLSGNPNVVGAELMGWSETSGAWVYNSNSAFGKFESGIGYGLTQTASGTITFSGSFISTFPLQKTVTLTDNANGYGWNLLGNPFPSSLKITDTSNGFLKINKSAIDDNYKAIYVYDDAIDNYLFIGAESADFKTGSEAYSQSHIQVGQGFFVLAKSNGAQFSFTSAMRDHQPIVPFKSAVVNSDWAGLQLKVKYGEKMNYTAVVYNNDMTAGLDPGYDLGQLSANPEVEIYTSLVIDNGVNFTRQALPTLSADKNVVPVGLASEKGGEITFMAEVIELAGYKFMLEDRQNGTFTDLSTDTYTVTIPEKTYGTGRFFLHAALATGINPVSAGNTLNLNVYTAQGRLNINGDVSNKATAAIYDLTGKKIMESRLGDTTRNSFAIPSGVSGIYLVKVTDGARVATAKVVF